MKRGAVGRWTKNSLCSLLKLILSDTVLCAMWVTRCDVMTTNIHPCINTSKCKRQLAGLSATSCARKINNELHVTVMPSCSATECMCVYHIA